MKSIVKSSYAHMWKELEIKLVDMAADRHMEHLPESKLLCAILVGAAIDHDEEYLNGPVFIDHCYWLKLHTNFVLSLFKRAWRIEKSGVVWEYTPPLVEDDNVN